MARCHANPGAFPTEIRQAMGYALGFCLVLQRSWRGGVAPARESGAGAEGWRRNVHLGHSKRREKPSCKNQTIGKSRDPPHFLGPIFVKAKRPFAATKRAGGALFTDLMG